MDRTKYMTEFESDKIHNLVRGMSREEQIEVIRALPPELIVEVQNQRITELNEALKEIQNITHNIKLC